LINLLDNACKFSIPASPILLSVKLSQDDIVVEVKDNGIGIPPEDLEKIFDKFYQVQHTKPNNGIGLGLSICKGIIEAHGGSIYANNNPEHGISRPS
jgi:two-component system sensor histidine kinase KdpD